jgi:two-component system CheB/CheR fusion protein
MPRSAINTGLVDFILSPEDMAAQLVQYISHYSLAPKLQTESNMNIDIITTLNLLKRASGVDFQKYKPATVLRRVEHRMNLKRFSLLSDYVKYLQTDPTEVDDLFRDLLIRVTSFFRDREAWDLLEHTVLNKIIGERKIFRELIS